MLISIQGEYGATIDIMTFCSLNNIFSIKNVTYIVKSFNF